MSMSKKRLSIIIPAYNAEKYIEDCLVSLQGILDDELEIIVINDGSVDNTIDIVDKCSREDQRIILLTVPNGGVSRARNIGLDKASGTYIMFLDSDDYIISDSIKNLSHVISNNNYDFAAFSRYVFYENGKSHEDPFPFEGNDTTDKNKLDFIMYADSHFNECWGKIYKRDIIDKYDIRFPEGIPVGEDMMFVMDYYAHCEKVYATNCSLVAYRQHVGSAMRRFGIGDRLNFTQNLYDYSEKYISNDLWDEHLFYGFKILTNLCREYSKQKPDFSMIRQVYVSKMAGEIMQNLKKGNVPVYRKHEYYMMKFKLLITSSVYYFIKARFS